MLHNGRNLSESVKSKSQKIWQIVIASEYLFQSAFCEFQNFPRSMHIWFLLYISIVKLKKYTGHFFEIACFKKVICLRRTRQLNLCQIHVEVKLYQKEKRPGWALLFSIKQISTKNRIVWPKQIRLTEYIFGHGVVMW